MKRIQRVRIPMSTCVKSRQRTTQGSADPIIILGDVLQSANFDCFSFLSFSLSPRLVGFITHKTISEYTNTYIQNKAMMSLKITLAALCLSFVTAFNARMPSLAGSRSALNAFTARTEDEAAFLMHKARECAFSDSCSVEEAEEYLSDVLRVQSGCAAGTLSSHVLCEEQDVVAEIVATLRAKVDGSRTYVFCRH
jgi:ATP-dependent Zn protease